MSPLAANPALNLGYLGIGWRDYARLPLPARCRLRWDFVFVFAGACYPEPFITPATLLARPRLYLFHREAHYGWTDPNPAGSAVLVLHFEHIPPQLAAWLSPGGHRCFPLAPATADRWRLVGPTLREHLRQPDDLLALRVERVLIDLTLLVAALAGPSCPTTPAPTGHDGYDQWKVERSLAWFEEHLTEAPRVATVAAEVGCSPGHLRKLYARAGFAAPQVEFQRRRMATASTWLQGGATPKDVAARLGFSEVSAFARAFRRTLGHPPGRLRAPTLVV